MIIELDEKRIKKGFRYEIRSDKDGVKVIEIPKGKTIKIINITESQK